MLLLSSLVLSLASLVFAQDANIMTIEQSLMSSKVIPDVLPSNFTPRFPIEVVFTDPSTKQIIPVTAGMNLTMNQTTNIPNFAILSNNTAIIGKPYLIAIVDPDAPSPPNRTIAQFLHFLGVNYVSSNITDNTLFILQNQSAPIMDYVNPTPPAGSVPHRYVVAMYLQASNNVTVRNGTVPANRQKFNLTTFANDAGNLTLLGATFFFVGPGNSTATNNSTSTSNATLSSILSGATNTAPGASASASGGSGGKGGAVSLDMVAPAVWSILATMFGAMVYFL